MTDGISGGYGTVEGATKNPWLKFLKNHERNENETYRAFLQRMSGEYHNPTQQTETKPDITQREYKKINRLAKTAIDQSKNPEPTMEQLEEFFKTKFGMTYNDFEHNLYPQWKVAKINKLSYDDKIHLSNLLRVLKRKI